MKHVQITLNLIDIPTQCLGGLLSGGCPFVMIGCSFNSCSAIIRSSGCTGPAEENECPKEGRRDDCPFNNAKVLNSEPFYSCSCCENYQRCGVGKCKETGLHVGLHDGCKNNYRPLRL